jgi:DNA-binding transcriptional regulator YhcF (GntR family)
MSKDATGGLGHNSRNMNLDEVAQQNVETGVLLLTKEFLVTAINDRNLDRTDLRVLAQVATQISRNTAKTAPDRRMMAQALGIAPETISNRLLKLRKMGYLIVGRERFPETGNRAVPTYTFGNVDHETLRREIEVFVERIRNPSAKTTSPPSVNSPPNITAHGDARRRSPSPPPVMRMSNITAPGDELPSPHTVTHSGKANKNNDILRGASPPPVMSSKNAVYNSKTQDSKTPTTAEPVERGSGGEKSKAKRAKPRSQLPSDWVPSPELIAWAKEVFVASDAQIKEQGYQFRDYHISRGNMMAEWSAAWRTWWGNGYHKIPRRTAPSLFDAPAKPVMSEEERKDRLIMGDEKYERYRQQLAAMKGGQNG